MAGRAALLAEVARSADEAAAEMVLPDAIHHDAGGEWIARVDDGLRELQSATAFREWLLRTEEAQKLAWDSIAFGEWIAAIEDAWGAGQRTIDQNRRVRRCSAVFDQEAVHIALRLPQLGGDAGREIHLDVRDVLIGHESGRIRLFEHCLVQFDARMLFQPGDEAMHDEGVEVFCVKELPEHLLGILFEFSGRFEIVGGLRTRAGHLLLTAFRHQIAVLFHQLGQFGVFSISARSEGLGAALEDAVERVVVARRDWIELVIVATGAGNREAQRAARDDINAVVDDVMRHAEKAPPEREKAHRREIG